MGLSLITTLEVFSIYFVYYELELASLYANEGELFFHHQHFLFQENFSALYISRSPCSLVNIDTRTAQKDDSENFVQKLFNSLFICFFLRVPKLFKIDSHLSTIRCKRTLSRHHLETYKQFLKLPTKKKPLFPISP